MTVIKQCKKNVCLPNLTVKTIATEKDILLSSTLRQERLNEQTSVLCVRSS